MDWKEPEAEIFAPLFSRLSGEDAEYYRRECEAGQFYDAFEEVCTSVRVAWVGATLEEVETVAVGQTEKAMPEAFELGESDNHMQSSYGIRLT